MQTSGRKQGFIISKNYILPAFPSSISSGKCVLLCLLSTALHRDAMEIKQLEDTTLDTDIFFRVDDETPITVSLICPEGTCVTVCRLGEAQSHSPSFTAGFGPRRKRSRCVFGTGWDQGTGDSQVGLPFARQQTQA